MTDELSFGLADLEINDDLDVSMDNETYQDQANPAPPPYGNYLLKAVKLGPKINNKTQKPVFEGDYPVLQLTTVEIVEGLPNPRKVTLFQDIKTKPFARSGTPASGLGDITRAYGTDSWAGIKAGVQLLEEAAQQGNLFSAQLDWSVYDGEGIKAAIAAAGLENVDKDSRTDDQKNVLNAIYRAGQITGQRFFPFNPETGKFSHVMILDGFSYKNPVSGVQANIPVPHRTLEARSTITRYYPKADFDGGRVKIGPISTKPASRN